MALKPVRLPSAREQAISELRKAVLSRQLQEGEIITLEEVAKELGISTTPVREAFQVLERDGLIELRQNRGARVLGIGQDSIREHYELREILEEQAVRLAVSKGSDLSGIVTPFRQPETTLRGKDPTGYSQFNFAFHQEIWLAAQNRKLCRLLTELWNGLSMGVTVSEGEYAKVSMREHEEILSAMCSGDAEEAASLMRSHIRRSMEDMLTYYA